MKKRIAINASGLHAGGGVQVATSLIDELTQLETNDLDIHIFASSEVDRNLEAISSNSRNINNYNKADIYGLSALKSELNRKLSGFDLVFTIFGPSYLRAQRGIQIVGFAQPWIIDKSAYPVLNTTESIKNRLKFTIQTMFFRRADKLIVELEHVKASIVKKRIAKPEAVEVVHNCISSLYFEKSTWKEIGCPIKSTKFSIGFIGRDYPHKNTNLLPEIRRIISEKYKIDTDFFTTLNESEWIEKSEVFKDSIKNVGSLSVAQCPTFYQAMDAVIFPSLLECFSASPLEAMAMQKPLFASDRGFVRDVCGDFAWYFDPLNAESAADVIAKYITQHHGKDQDRLAAAREHVLNFSNARQRAESYLNIIRKALAETAL